MEKVLETENILIKSSRMEFYDRIHINGTCSSSFMAYKTSSQTRSTFYVIHVSFALVNNPEIAA